MAPEIAESGQQHDEKADVFSMGKLVYHVSSTRTPVDRTASHVFTVIMCSYTDSCPRRKTRRTKDLLTSRPFRGPCAHRQQLAISSSLCCACSHYKALFSASFDGIPQPLVDMLKRMLLLQPPSRPDMLDFLNSSFFNDVRSSVQP